MFGSYLADIFQPYPGNEDLDTLNYNIDVYRAIKPSSLGEIQSND